jgi:hypothetical protein
MQYNHKIMSKEQPKQGEQKKKCGIIMPIASNDDYPNDHWKDVLQILVESIDQTPFEPRLVSDDVAIGLIHDRIVTNIYNDEIVVCDVSSKNPNVMFELGLRLAFDKPTIIIKDEKTGYSFDTGVIEHISYPSSLRFSQIVDFKKELARRIIATYEKSQKEPNYSPFLKSFGKTIIPATIGKTEIPEGKFILEQLETLRQDIRMLRIEKINNLNNRPIINDKTKHSFIYNLIARYDKDGIDINSNDIFNPIRKEILNNGFEISVRDFKNAMDDYINDTIQYGKK